MGKIKEQTATVLNVTSAAYLIRNMSVFKKGQYIRWRNSKRIFIEILDSYSLENEETTLEFVRVWQPSPKSTLRRKSIFTKNKNKLKI